MPTPNPGRGANRPAPKTPHPIQEIASRAAWELSDLIHKEAFRPPEVSKVILRACVELIEKGGVEGALRTAETRLGAVYSTAAETKCRTALQFLCDVSEAAGVGRNEETKQP